jgi:hypothetical protein
VDPLFLLLQLQYGTSNGQDCLGDASHRFDGFPSNETSGLGDDNAEKKKPPHQMQVKS